MAAPFAVWLNMCILRGIIWHMRRMNIFFPEPLIAALKALSKNTGLPVSEHIRRAIDEYLKRQ